MASALCNWCGAKIEDPEFQERAAAARHQADEAERARVEAMQQEEAKFGVIGRLRRIAKQTKTEGGGTGNTLTP